MEKLEMKYCQRFSPYSIDGVLERNAGDLARESDNQPCSSRERSGFKKIASLWTAQLLQERETNKQKDPANRERREIVKEDLAMIDQGNHEVEVGVAEAYEAAMNWGNCSKNPGHIDFIPVTQFSLKHLPENVQDEDVLKFVHLLSKLIVKVSSSFTSLNRPDEYPFHNCRGTHLTRTGTGKVAEITTVDNENTPCPCPECKASDQPKKRWKAIWIMTAMHVVYDDDEVVKTTVQLFFDNSNSQSGVRVLHGLRVVDSNMIGDWCKFECATHDLDLAEDLEKVDQPLIELGDIIKEKHRNTDVFPLAVIVAHPHGCAKHITVGQWKERKYVENKEEKYEWTEYAYSTGTCKGSSGAPVWILGSDRVHYWSYYCHVHSEGFKDGLNKSGAGDVEKRWDW